MFFLSHTKHSTQVAQHISYSFNLLVLRACNSSLLCDWLIVVLTRGGLKNAAGRRKEDRLRHQHLQVRVDHPRQGSCCQVQGRRSRHPSRHHCVVTVAGRAIWKSGVFETCWLPSCKSWKDYHTGLLSAHRNCFAIPKLTYNLRSAPCFLERQLLTNYDAVIQSTLQFILNITLSDEGWEQVSLPNGGLDLRSAIDIALSVFSRRITISHSLARTA